MLIGLAYDLDVSGYLCFLTAASIFVICFFRLINGNDALNLNLFSPSRLYGFFFCLYCCTSLLLFVIDPNRPQHNSVKIAAITVVGFLGWSMGMSVTGGESQAPTEVIRFRPHEYQGLFRLAIVGSAFVATYYLWRLSIGQFYSHAEYFEQETTLSASFFNSVCGAFVFPVPLILGIATGAPDPKLARRVRLFAFACCTALCVTETLASEFRPALTTMVLLAAGMQTAGTLRVRWKQVIIAAVVSLTSLVVVQSTRLIASSTMMNSQNQLIDSISAIPYALEQAIVEGKTQPGEATSSRAVQQAVFLSDIIDAIESGQSYLAARGKSGLAILPPGKLQSPE
jgi:hypothetical protein